MMKLLAATCLSAGLLCSHGAAAMTLNPRGTGQVLLFPYFTVNRHQQTLLSVSNLTAATKVARVRFREAYDGREVLDFNVFLPAHGTWTSALFSLDDAGLAGSGAAILDNDNLCTLPAFNAANTLPDGRRYQPFLNFAYTGAQADGGPADDARTREGYFEIVEMAELTGATRANVTPVNGVPPGCGRVAATEVPAADLLPPRGGLSGSAAIVDVPIGTFYATSATALDGVFAQPVYTPSGSVAPDLRDASAGANGLVSAYVPVNGAYLTLDYAPAQAVDAASALLASSEIVTDYDISADAGAQTDWVVTFPTKHFYVDPQIVTDRQPVAPFDDLFGGSEPGRSDVSIGINVFDRSGNPLIFGNGITPPPPPPPPLVPPLPYETQVVMFIPQSQQLPAVSPVLAAAHPLSVHLGETYDVGVAHLYLAGPNGASHRLRAAHDGTQLQGLPVIGFEAVNYINANVTPGVLANYSAALPMRSLAPCAGTCP